MAVEDWTADVVGRMHKYRITGKALAAEAGITAAYLSTVLNGHKGTPGTREKIVSALKKLEREAQSTAPPAEEDGV